MNASLRDTTEFSKCFSVFSIAIAISILCWAKKLPKTTGTLYLLHFISILLMMEGKHSKTSLILKGSLTIQSEWLKWLKKGEKNIPDFFTNEHCRKKRETITNKNEQIERLNSGFFPP